MKFAAAILVVLSIAAGEANKCELINGQNLRQFNGRNLAMKLPCKFNMIHQTCGNYQVTLTPGLKYLYPTYIVDTVWLAVKDLTTDQFWEGRTTTKVTAKYIIAQYHGEEREAWNYKEGDLVFSDIFDVSYTTGDVTVTAKDGSFAITVGPYDFNGKANKDSRVVFECFVDNEPTPFPEQYCGSTEGQEIKDQTKAMFEDGSLLQYTIPYGVFNDPSIEQMDELCIEATSVFTTQCSDHTQRRNAIAVCEKILQSPGHTQCVAKYACKPMEVFVNCLKYVCSDYTDKDACEAVGGGIDLCRNFGGVNRYDLMGLTDRVKGANCYKDLLTQEDNPFYNIA